jgi:hypothetical protein
MMSHQQQTQRPYLGWLRVEVASTGVGRDQSTAEPEQSGACRIAWQTDGAGNQRGASTEAMKFFSDMLSEGDGSPSTMRVLNLLIVAVVLGCWSAVSIHKWELQPLSVEEMGLILGALGMKAWQRGREANPSANAGNLGAGD